MFQSEGITLRTQNKICRVSKCRQKFEDKKTAKITRKIVQWMGNLEKK